MRSKKLSIRLLHRRRDNTPLYIDYMTTTRASHRYVLTVPIFFHNLILWTNGVFLTTAAPQSHSGQQFIHALIDLFFVFEYVGSVAAF